ncbi:MULTISPECIES: DUF6701 domain-containing protein [unclassified Vibrio]|jgi:MSHA biogenesis protein MshQ|uniref:DUF6701 domain-containing protein n=1 Tax=unclassified Vibrio TaxID=2614977 RepID=UPI000DFE85C9|nr:MULTISPECIES: DUF6701 domain-containing protein [unclassified Vibrio]RCW20708.1 MSHA biogenesis protein MshQ [Vibrio parahaemolyticus]HDU8579016.1 hypothetical protein [Vibrio diabolicus]
MKKLICFALIWMMSTANVLAKEYDITPEATYRWWGWKFDGWMPKDADNLCSNGYLEGKDSREPIPTTYVCPNGLMLNSGDTIVSDSEMSIRSWGEILLKRNNYIGKSNVPINLFSIGEVKTEQDTNIIIGNVTADRNITFKGATVEGDVTSKGEIKTEQGPNIINGNVTASGNITLKKTQVDGAVTSQGGEVKTEQGGNEIQGDVWALSKITLQKTKVTGNVTSEGEEVILEGSGNSNEIHGNIWARNKVDIKNSLVCGSVVSQGHEVLLNNSKENKNRGIYALTHAIHSHGEATVKNSSVCGVVWSDDNSYDFHKEKIYCGIDDPTCQPSQTDGACPIETITSLCPEFIPEPPPIDKCHELDKEEFSNASSIENWSITGLDGSELPYVTSNGRFRLTKNLNNQSTAAAYNYTFPMSDNYILIDFEHYVHGSSDGGDGIALVFSDANVPPSAGAFGGPLGYGVKLKSQYTDDPNVTRDIEGFAGGWLGIGIDEYGNYELQGAPVRKYGNRIKNNIAIRGPGIKKNDGTWLDGYQFIKSISSDKRINIDERPTTVHRYQIEITTRLDANGEEKVLLNVYRQIGGGDWDSLLSALDVTRYVNVVSKPENLRLSVTASTGGAKNNHEIDNFQVCAEDVNKIVDGIDHFRFEYVSSGDVCSSQQVVLKACLDEFCDLTYPSNAAGKVEALEPLMVQLEDIPGAKWLDANGHELNGRFELRNEKKLQIQSLGADVANLGIAYSSIPQYNFKPVQCKLSDSGQFDDKCEIRFDHALNLFVPDKIAALSFFDGQGHLRGDYSTGASLALCETSSEQDIEVRKDVEFKLSNNSVISEPLSVRVGESEVSLDKSTWKKVQDVHFERGKIDLDVNYNDAGKVTLLARVADDSAENSATFVSFPDYFDIDTSRLTDGASGTCIGVDKGCSDGFVAATDEFGVKVIARNALGEVTKSYAEPHMEFGIDVKYPNSPNARSGALLHPTLPAESFWANGVLNLNQSVFDVGAFTITVKAPEGTNGKSKYLDSEAFKIQDGKTTIGRIYPGLFSVVGNPSLSSLAPSNSWSYGDQSFVYMGQGFGVKEFFVEAFASNGAPLQNYAYFDAHQAQFALFENDTVRSSRFVAWPSYSSEWDSALGSGRSVGRFIGTKDDGLIYNKQLVSEVYADGPFNLNEARSDTNISIMGVEENSDPTNIGQGKLSVQPDIRFGRIALDDVGGNQGSTLHIPLRVEYWNGERFTLNLDDSQTDVSGVKEKQELVWSEKKNTDGVAQDVDVALSAGGKVIAGRSRSIEATEAESNRQQTRVWLDLDDSKNGLPWLKYNWDNKKAGEENPSSVVTFGIHRGNDRVIYRGEPGLTGQ